MSHNTFNTYGFGEGILQALQELGYEHPTRVQEQVIPLVLEEKDIIVQSQTGSGKTAAFAIPVCEKIVVEQRNPQVLVLTPTRELAVQLKQEISNIGRFKRIRCAAVFGRHPMAVQKRELQQRVHIIVGTPGRTFDHIERNNVNLVDIRFLIIDEADKMLDMGFLEQVEAIINRLPRRRVTLLFSATMPDKIREICHHYMKEAMTVEVEADNSSTKQIRQMYYQVEEQDKLDLLQTLMYTQKPDSCILFCNTREKVETVSEALLRKGYRCASLHGGMEQRDRLQTIASFKRGEFPFLIGTDVVARGIHIDEISLVINYDLPLDPDSYVHRIGRTGRAGNAGTAMTLVTGHEMTAFHQIEEYVHYEIPTGEVPTMDDVARGKEHMYHKPAQPILKIDKSDVLNQDICRIRINAGKQNKMRPGDILGAITSIAGLSGEDIGIIDVQDSCSYVELLRGKGKIVLEALHQTKIKGKIHKVKEVGFPMI